MYAVKQAPKNSSASGKHGSGAVPKMGSGRSDRVFKKPSKGGPISTMGRSIPGSKTGK